MSAPHKVDYVIRPDALDFRDRIYTPTLDSLPPTFNARPYANAKARARVKDQKLTNACTGFALSALVEHLLDQSNRLPPAQKATALGRISPYMLYYFARRYDEFSGEADTGSSARAAMKAWHKHGACLTTKWPTDAYPRNRKWVADGFRHPLGAYYRVNHTSLADMHAALRETGVLYVTAALHEGWWKKVFLKRTGRIPFEREEEEVGGHAFLLVGYDNKGFWIQNSWGSGWGWNGFAHLSYGDWQRNGWDAWVAQIGVSTSIYLDTLEQGLSYRALTKDEKQEAFVSPAEATAHLLSTNASISAQQITPYIINLGNNGRLSDTGSFTTTSRDLWLFATHYLPRAIKDFKLGKNDPIDLAIYAHGGLTGEDSAAATARTWIPSLYARRIVPLFIMWETGFLDTVGNILSEALFKNREAGGLPTDLKNWATERLDERLEGVAARPGTLLWDEMKENAEAASKGADSGLVQLYQTLLNEAKKLLPRLRIHLIAHSAGSILHAHLLPKLLAENLRVDGLYFLAPAARCELFEEKILPHYRAGKIPCYTQFHLDDRAERDDTCKGIYRKSLLYLVSNAFEGRRGAPILGMEKFVTSKMRAKPHSRTAVWDWIASPTSLHAPPDSQSSATSHGGFGTEPATVISILDRITARTKTPLVPINSASVAVTP